MVTKTKPAGHVLVGDVLIYRSGSGRITKQLVSKVGPPNYDGDIFIKDYAGGVMIDDLIRIDFPATYEKGLAGGKIEVSPKAFLVYLKNEQVEYEVK